MQIVGCMALAAFVICFVMLMFSRSVPELIFKLVAGCYFGMLYLRYAMQLWVCRKAWNDPSLMTATLSFTSGNFMNEVGLKPSELLPLNLDKNGGPKQ